MASAFPESEPVVKIFQFSHADHPVRYSKTKLPKIEEMINPIIHPRSKNAILFIINPTNLIVVLRDKQ